MFLFIHYRFLLQSSYFALQNSKDFPLGPYPSNLQLYKTAAQQNTLDWIEVIYIVEGNSIFDKSPVAKSILASLLTVRRQEQGPTPHELCCFTLVIARTAAHIANLETFS